MVYSQLLCSGYITYVPTILFKDIFDDTNT